MLLSKELVYNKFIQSVKEGKYKPIDSHAFQQLYALAPMRWDIRVLPTYPAVKIAEIEVTYSGCLSPCIFPVNDHSFGSFVLDRYYGGIVPFIFNYK